MIELDDDDDLRLIEIFRQKAAYERQERQAIALERFDDERKRRHEHERRKEEEERKLLETMATPAQVAAFDEHLDSYDTATVHALMDNQHALDAVYSEREQMDASAYRLPDGRMVFKTEDGKRVFDRQGAEVPSDTMHADAIPNSAPRWETFQANVEAENKLLHERDALHDYQHRLDDAREAAGKDGVTAEALAKMDADLKRDMPDAVRQQLPGGKPSVEPVQVSSAFSPASERTPYRYAGAAPAAP